MSSGDAGTGRGQPDPGRREPAGTHAGGREPAAVAHPTAGRDVRKITEPRAMRALAHPVRLALLEALAHAGTLTATQASDLLGESPANCAFHLRTLAKYGYVEETGGGRGRERPWRRVRTSLNITSEPGDAGSAAAEAELAQFLLDTLLDRARRFLLRKDSWPARWQHSGLGYSQSQAYVTPGEARELEEAILSLARRYEDRLDHPERRPADAMPVEIVWLSYPLLHLAARQDPGTVGTARAVTGSDPGAPAPVRDGD